jgi:hypothetical protein
MGAIILHMPLARGNEREWNDPAAYHCGSDIICRNGLHPGSKREAMRIIFSGVVASADAM